ncbi:helix-turn-helix domain-containing protein [Natrinema salinisoli]|uniref:helix-turn-helix domain-containing protein n=1 Tax=Natrinema salinisoli TaxID=2878535 RepID=UPI001CEFC3B0|nr:helix-turn-helix domain-containing protein [Natrinema salinisoli]
MTLSAKFRIPVKVLPLGSILSDFDNIVFELVRVIPTRDGFIPYFWISGENLDEFEHALEDHPRILSLELLDTVNHDHLYQAEWDVKHGEFFAGLIDTDAAVLEAYSTDRYWFFHFRFPDHDQLTQFYNYCLENEIKGIELEHVYSFNERSNHFFEYNLTPEQREALVLAAQRGYFSTPREVTLEELATELDISQQALSQRVRGATEKVVLGALNLPLKPE